MSSNVINPNELCPCGSQLKARVCCYPLKAPIQMVAPPYVSENIVEVISPELDNLLNSNAPEQVKDIAKSLSSLTITQTYSQKAGPGILSKGQINHQISSVLGYSPDGYYLDSKRNEHSLVSPLHIVKYHQQQCMYRIIELQRQAKRHSRNNRKRKIGFKEVRFIQVIQFEDIPLRAEYEAFVSRIASSLDALAKYVCDCIGKSKEKYGKHFSLLNHLQKHDENKPVFVLLREVYKKYENWSQTNIIGLRHVVMHEGTLWSLEPSKEMSVDVRFLTPSNNGNRIDQLCIEHWNTLIEMVTSIRDVLIKYNLTD